MNFFPGNAHDNTPLNPQNQFRGFRGGGLKAISEKKVPSKNRWFSLLDEIKDRKKDKNIDAGLHKVSLRDDSERTDLPSLTSGEKQENLSHTTPLNPLNLAKSLSASSSGENSVTHKQITDQALLAILSALNRFMRQYRSNLQSSGWSESNLWSGLNPNTATTLDEMPALPLMLVDGTKIKNINQHRILMENGLAWTCNGVWLGGEELKKFEAFATNGRVDILSTG